MSARQVHISELAGEDLVGNFTSKPDELFKVLRKEMDWFWLRVGVQKPTFLPGVHRVWLSSKQTVERVCVTYWTSMWGKAQQSVRFPAWTFILRRKATACHLFVSTATHVRKFNVVKFSKHFSKLVLFISLAEPTFSNILFYSIKTLQKQKTAVWRGQNYK